MSLDDVKSYYNGMGEREWLRLTNPADGAIEFAVTTHILNSYLPPNSRVLDIGGGPGRYAIWLAQAGHRVTLADLSAGLLEIARQKIAEAGVGDRLEEVVEANACDLSHWPDEQFDAVVCLGPFYHLPDPAERDQAAREIVRVLKAGGRAFVAFMPVQAFLRRTLALPDERHHLTQPGWLAQLLDQGLFTNDVPGRFNRGFGVRPEQIPPFFQRFGLTTLKLLSTEGISGGSQEAIAGLKATDPVSYQASLDLIIKTAADPAILGMSSHLLYVGQKPG